MAYIKRPFQPNNPYDDQVEIELEIANDNFDILSQAFENENPATFKVKNALTADRFKQIDLTNITEDYFLNVGEHAYISFTNTTFLPLHIATTDNTVYELDLLPSNPGGTSGGGLNPIFLNPNNTTYNNAFYIAGVFRNSERLDSFYEFHSGFRIGWALSHLRIIILNRTVLKSIISFNNVYGVAQDYPTLIFSTTNWRDTTTPWTSLGTITFPQTTSGEILIRRLR